MVHLQAAGEKWKRCDISSAMLTKLTQHFIMGMQGMRCLRAGCERTKGSEKMKKFFSKAFHIKGKHRRILIAVSVTIALTIAITSVGAWLHTTGLMATNKITNPNPVNWDGGASFFEVYGERQIISPPPLQDPLLPIFYLNGEIINENEYDSIFRISLTEIIEEYPHERSSDINKGDPWKPVIYYYPDLKGFPVDIFEYPEVPYENIIWQEEKLGPKPAGMHVHYRLRKVDMAPESCTLYSYIEVKDEEGNLIGIRTMRFPFGTYDLQNSTTIDKLYADSNPNNAQYVYYSDHPDDLLIVGTQWFTDTIESTVPGTKDDPWVTRHPTLETVVKDWNAAVPLVQLQSKTSYLSNLFDVALKAPNLTKTPTANKWFYNENDGYFYYIGIMKAGSNIPAPFILEDLVYSDTIYKTAFFKEFSCGAHGDIVQANKDAATALWGLTYEPGSLGAAIFAEYAE